jgi:hypothetical protein
MGETFAYGLHARLNDMSWGFEVGLTDLQMNYLFTPSFQSPRLSQYFESRFGTQIVHAGGNCHLSSTA